MESLGNHLVAEFFGCQSKKLDDRRHITELVKTALEVSGDIPPKIRIHIKFKPKTISALSFTDRGHFSIHVWPEKLYAAIDYFSCGDKIETRRALTHFNEQLQPDFVMVGSLDRGKISDFTKLKAACGSNHPHMVWHDWR